MANEAVPIYQKRDSKTKMYADDKKLYFWTIRGTKYLNHGGKCIMLDTKVRGIIKLKCFKNHTEAQREFMNDFYWS